MNMRINKYLDLCGVASRRKADELIVSGRVLLNGKKATLGQEVDERKDIVTVDGKEVKLASNYIYIKMNKPKGYICSEHDERGRKTVFELLKGKIDTRVFSIGRLDYDTEGLLLFTNDGDMAQKLMHPSHEVEKTYHVTIEGTISQSELAVLRAGVVVKGSRMPQCKADFVESTKKPNGKTVTKVSIKIKQGQNRQVRRMFEAIGKEIILLKRVAIGDITLGSLKRGETKPLSEKELSILNEIYYI